MRRYGSTRYGGFGNSYPAREQPGDFPDVPTGSMPVLPTPADILPRRPSRLGEGGGQVTPFPGIRTGRLPPLGNLDPQEFIRLLMEEQQKAHQSYTNFDALRYASFNNIPLLIGVADQVVLQHATDIRVYLFLINTHPVNTLFLAFKTLSTAVLGVPIAPNLGFFEFNAVVPQDDVHLIANAAGTTGVMLYGELPPSRLSAPQGMVG